MYTILNKYSFHCFRYGYFKWTCQPGPKFQLHVIWRHCWDLTQRTYFKDYKFIYNPEVSALINDIPDGTVYSTKTSGPKPPLQQKGPRLSPSELGKLPRVAKDLNLSDTRKAFAIDSFVMEFLNMKIQGVQSDYSKCLLRVWGYNLETKTICTMKMEKCTQLLI